MRNFDACAANFRFYVHTHTQYTVLKKRPHSTYYIYVHRIYGRCEASGGRLASLAYTT